MKKMILIVVAVILVAAVALGSFFGGAAYQKSQSNKIQEEFFTTRGGQPPSGDFDGQMPPGGQMQFDSSGTGAFAGRGLSGEIQALDGDTLLMTTLDGVITVNLSDSTRILKSVDADADDLQAGTNVTIVGQQQEDGTITAAQIQIIDSELMQQFAPQATGTAP